MRIAVVLVDLNLKINYMYELLKQLKEAGFPQDGYGIYIEEPNNRREPYLQRTENAVYNPTTDELIEVVGVELIIWNYKGEWYSGLLGHMEKGINYIDGYPNYCENGDTLKESLIKLYLAIHTNAKT